MERLEYIDVFRGVAILDMIILQIFDVLSKLSIYSDPPFYYAPLNWTAFPPPLLFTFVAGMSVFLLTEKLLQNKEKSIPFKVVKRYGFYVLISLPFTWFMWNLATYLGWNEAIQGIGLTAIFLSLILMVKPRVRNLLAMTLIFSGLQAALFYLTRGISYGLAADTILNALARGWFSVANLLPLMLGGVLFFKLIKSGKIKAAWAMAVAFTLLGIVLHLAGLKIDYYERSLAFSIFAVGLAALVVLAVYALWKRFRNINWRPAIALGQASFAIYIGHYLFIIKPLRLLGLADKLGNWISLVLTIVLVIAIYFVVEYYLKLKMKFKK
ncbi:MAG: hypothetical protein V1839_01070 [archaeon]